MSLFLFVPAFIASVFLAFYVPGRVIFGNQKKLSKVGIFAVSFILGIVLWGWQGYIFGFLHLRFLSYLYLLVFLAIFLKRKYFLFTIPKIRIRSIDWPTLLMLIVGIIAQVIPFLRNGQMTSSGLFLSNYNVQDHIWHATLIEELVRRFPPNEPGMYGVLLTNYHFWFNLVTAEIVRVFHLPLFSTQFIGMYALGPILLGFIVCVFAKAVYDSKMFLRLLILLIFFSGDAAGWFMLLLKHRFDLVVGWLFEDGTKLMDSPGRGFAVLIVMAGLYLLLINREKISRKNILIISLLFGSLIGFKIYFGIPFLLGLLGLAIFDGIKRNFSSFWIFAFASFFSIVEFLPFNATSGGLFYLFLEMPRQFIIQESFGLSYVDMRLAIYREHHNYFRLIEYGTIMTFTYLIVQFGIKFFGFLPLKKTVNALGVKLIVLLYSTLIATLVLGLFFYQKIGGANIWEFFLTSSLILAITVSLNISLYLPRSNKLISGILISAIFILVIPRWVNSVGMYLRYDYFSAFHGISREELQLYDFLKNDTLKDSLVVLPNQHYIPFSSIVSVLAERNLFLSGQGVSQVLTPVMVKRRNDLDTIRYSPDAKKINVVLKKDKINYVVIYNYSSVPTVSTNPQLHEVFSNGFGKIYKVD